MAKVLVVDDEKLQRFPQIIRSFMPCLQAPERVSADGKIL